MTTESKSTDLDTGFFGHPQGLSTLFFTEMWERFSYYGMRALLVLFMTASIQEGGLFITVASASAIYGLYTGAVYLMGLPGGWIADRLLGCQKTVWYGGLIIFSGHVVLAIPNDSTFFIGLVLVVLGTGLLKPNIGAMVGQLYSKNDKRRDAGYTLYYMGINIGAFLAYLAVGPLKEQGLWHWAFGLAAVGMALGLVLYRKTIYKLGDAGAEPTVKSSPKMIRTSWGIITCFLLALALMMVLIMSGSIVVDPVATAEYAAVIITAIFLAYFAGVFFLGNLDGNEKRSLSALFLVCVASACFWAGFEQAGSSLNLFAQDYTNRMVGSFEIPTIWFQLSNSAFIIMLAPFIAALWINLAKKMITPSYGIKCALGLIIMALGFLVMFFAAQYAAAGMKVAPYWLVTTYFLHTVGELCLSPVALSAVSKLSPKRFAGQMMGVFVLTYSIGNVVAGLLAGNFDPENLDQMPELFMQICLVSTLIGVVIAILTLKTGKWEKLTNE
ncbi:peptide MFS transporter [Paraglaciecola sp. L3A3]|uniref:peptide MFS transporter n=1 Tax=Paraglaciecola sp. L3A3 TaxID=2686358 RepID=UPI00131AC8D5|nr:peptide MFS transporter [Paraglaciecola sp. L3A3]